MMDLLLDVDIVVDVCSGRRPWSFSSAEAICKCQDSGQRVWLYTGSVQNMEFAVAKEIYNLNQERGFSLANSLEAARKVLAEFCTDKHWLASLAGEGPVFCYDDPEGEQFISALKRFSNYSIKLLTRDSRLAARYPEYTIAPEEYLGQCGAATGVKFVDLQTQQDRIRPGLERRVHRVLHHGKYIMGPEIKELEEGLSSFVGCRHCISCSSGTDALLMALMACGVGPGDAVFTSPFTFIATAEVIALLGATPVFVDIDPLTFNMDPQQLETAIQAVHNNDPQLYPLPGSLSSGSNKTATSLNPGCILPVDLFGLPADYDSIHRVADKYGLRVVEDAAQSLGAQYQGRSAGNLAHIGCTSFFPAKPLGAYGDGGALFTDDEDLAHELVSIRVHGQGGHKYDNARIGINARLDSMQAAVLLSKLEIFPEEIESRQRAAGRYREILNSVPGLQNPFVPTGYTSVWAQYSLLAQNGEQRELLQSGLRDRDIPSVIYYPKPLHQQSAFSYLAYRPSDMPISQDCAQRIFSLPMHPYLSENEQERICSCISKT